MRLNIVKSKNSIQYYIIESTYIHGQHSTRTVEKVGTYDELIKDHPDPEAFARQRVAELNAAQKAEREANKNKGKVLVPLDAGKQIVKDARYTFNGGYLFLQKIFYELGLDKICDACAASSKAEYNLTEILSRLVYSRILDPGSKAKTYEFSQKLIEQSSFEQHDIYRALTLLSKNQDYIQSQLYKNSKKAFGRNGRILYYDCTNYYFEIEQEDDFRKYGKAKSHKPNPIVEMGLFMDADGIPLAFSMHPGNVNEQITLTPLEKKLEAEFNLSKFIVCTDAGLSSKTNRLFNSVEDKSFITTQSIKKLSKDHQEWALAADGWKLLGADSEKEYRIDEIESGEYVDANGKSIFYDKIFYKEKNYTDEVEVIDKNGNKGKEYINEKFIITYSLKYRDYLRCIRDGQIQRANALIKSCTNGDGTVNKSAIIKKHNQTDFKRFIQQTSIDPSSGEVLSDLVYTLKSDLIKQEEKYDGFYGVATDLDEDAEVIININRKRWEIEECFRIIKTDFNAEPIYLSREDRINAHFLTCFIALIIYRFLEKKVSSKEKTYTINEIVSQLKDMNFYVSSGNGYIPTYTRTEFTDRLHQVFGFRTDYEIIPIKDMRKIIQNSKR